MKFFAFIFLIISFTANAVIIETAKIHDILPYIQEDSLVLLDLDDTLIDSTTYFGSGPWRQRVREQVARLEKENKIPKIQTAKHITSFSRYYVTMRPVEDEETRNLLTYLKEKDIQHLILTARSKSFLDSPLNDWFAKITFKQLETAQISIPETTLPFPDEIYAKGILFSGVDEKGQFLKDLFEQMGYYPQKIIFVDDKKEVLEDLERELTPIGIEFTGFWYRAVDNFWQGYDPLIGDIQFKYLLLANHLLSDEEAKELRQDCETENTFEEIFQIFTAQEIIDRNYQNLQKL